MAPARKGRPSLRQGLDKEVLQVIRKLIDDQPGDNPDLSVYTVSDWIKRSNSSLARRPRKALEDSIERVLEVIKEDEASGDEEMAPIDADLDGNQAEHMSAENAMNVALRGNLAKQTASSETAKKRDTQRLPDGQPAKKKRKAEKEEINTAPPTHISLEQLGGVDNVKEQLMEHLVMPLLCPDEYTRRGITIPRGILLHGPPGCGKTVISKAFANKLGVPFIEILGPSIVSGMSGESEKQVREHFEEARKNAPCLLFIDEIDVIAPKRDTSQSQMEKRIVAQLLISMDSLAVEANDGKPVIVLAATNRPDSLDSALRRGGRFDTEINMGVPNEKTRELILRAQTRDTNVGPDVDFAYLAKNTGGFVGADLRDLVGKAGSWSMDRYREALLKQAEEMQMEMDVDAVAKAEASVVDKRITRLVQRVRRTDLPRPEGFETVTIGMDAFLAVLPHIQPSSKREGFATVPDTTWEDIGALHDIREELEMAIVEPIQHPERYKQVGITAPTGVLLWGPPGCGKTLLAKAVANESKANFISVKGPELLNKYVGESERAVRQVFMRARSSVPCVIFFDELDALVPRRNDSQSEASTRVVNTLLTELDGLSAREGIYVIAATNRPDMIDDAMLRPGRLETMLFVGLPGPGERAEILRALIKRTPINEIYAEFARDCDNYSGADLSSLLRQAGQNALRRKSAEVTLEDFYKAKEKIVPSVGDLQRYELLKKRLASRS
ncbi:P-loop containing nucleoside triphosphate hydrolase protein [Macrophomina phaseolina]|uniref:P-loop containing nucleoside triphosphate hydrolase protein n=1 Tax=Macrophomina phaseolina TaxID=35725 RepID=A0ABQ8GJU5_9PEZI|nr:P-loop containing nucleoside triphosphate hydrolase protein [Macrophomina phaseolina]